MIRYDSRSADCKWQILIYFIDCGSGSGDRAIALERKGG